MSDGRGKAARGGRRGAYWREFLTRGDPIEAASTSSSRLLPHGPPRYKLCAAPFAGAGSHLMRVDRKRPAANATVCKPPVRLHGEAPRWRRDRWQLPLRRHPRLDEPRERLPPPAFEPSSIGSTPSRARSSSTMTAASTSSSATRSSRSSPAAVRSAACAAAPSRLPSRCFARRATEAEGRGYRSASASRADGLGRRGRRREAHGPDRAR